MPRRTTEPFGTVPEHTLTPLQRSGLFTMAEAVREAFPEDPDTATRLLFRTTCVVDGRKMSLLLFVPVRLRLQPVCKTGGSLAFDTRHKQLVVREIRAVHGTYVRPFRMRGSG